ncbi:anaphase-promoting complex subunit 10 [Pseudoloma neurophilia]|uniref:Anaphase-promoting complex subunit 10 n=1 Tax=Pseudoloma neurophilia TaxID=146866 RepID=A0A0R0M8L9_9MICR|nr:anaphase-promoting complex subunit 10 [Pseudoloma neurophilia]
MRVFLSSTKPGHRLADLLSSNPDSYWHTNDSLPHFFHVEFPVLTYIQKLTIDLSYDSDDSYTPEHISIFVDQKHQQSRKLFEPEGTTVFEVKKSLFTLDLVIRANHQEGRDSHVRGIKLYGQDNKVIPLEASSYEK